MFTATTQEYIKPQIFQLARDSSTDLTNDTTQPIVSLTPDINFPKFELGFTFFIHFNRKEFARYVNRDIKSTAANKLQSHNYRVFNLFEANNQIANASQLYFAEQEPIMSRGFYKMWEMLMYHSLVDINKPIVTAHLGEGPGSFMQAVSYYRSKFYSTQASDDHVYGITLHMGQKSNLNFDKEVTHSTKFRLFPTVPTNKIRNSRDASDGDLTKPRTAELFAAFMGDEQADLVTADGGFDWKNELLQEQEGARLILGEILTALKVQKPGGAFVCKIYETFTFTSVKILNLLMNCYDQVLLNKPLTSRQSNSEKYVICLGFQSDKIASITPMLDELYAHLNVEPHMAIDVYPHLPISSKLIRMMGYVNINLASTQYDVLQRMIKFIDSGIYGGEEYEVNKAKQTESCEAWINTFYPDVGDFTAYKTQLQQLVRNTIAANERK